MTVILIRPPRPVRKGHTVPYRSGLGAKVRVDSVTGCWVWIAARFTKRGGYGKVYDHGRIRRAHIVVYERWYGVGAAEGWDLHHQCGNTACVNPRHLEKRPAMMHRVQSLPWYPKTATK